MPPCGVFTESNVPAAKVDQVIADFQLDSPIKIDKVDNGDGTFEVTATFPPCADGSPQGNN